MSEVELISNDNLQELKDKYNLSRLDLFWLLGGIVDANKPLNLTRSILFRYIEQYGFDLLMARKPKPIDVFQKITAYCAKYGIESLSAGEFANLLGRSNTTSYRWLDDDTNGASTCSDVTQLLRLFEYYVDDTPPAEFRMFIETMRTILMDEAGARNVDKSILTCLHEFRDKETGKPIYTNRRITKK